MVILGIESSCDETAAAVVEISAYGKPSADKGIHILSNVVASSADLQAKYGGVIPEQAAREQLRSIIPVIETALNKAFPNVIPSKARNHKFKESRDPSSLITPQDDRVKKIDAIAITYGPGLIGSLLVGVETAKTLAMVWNKPLIPVNHLLGHFYANWIEIESRVKIQESSKKKSRLLQLATSDLPKFPCTGLLVSGGHTDLLLFKDHGKYEYLGGTRDDAAGECFDKCARLLGLPYPGGPNLAKLASEGDALQLKLPRPMINSKDLDFSFSGLKTAVANLIKESPELFNLNKDLPLPGKIASSSATPRNDEQGIRNYKTLADLAASIEAAIVDVLVAKTIRAAQTYKVEQIMIAGGVAANQRLASELKLKIENLKLKINLHIPSADLCTDNAAMIATAAFFNSKPIDPFTLQANPSLGLT